MAVASELVRRYSAIAACLWRSARALGRTRRRKVPRCRDYTVHNVAPRAGGVDIWVNIEWDSDIRIYVDYLVINP